MGGEICPLEFEPQQVIAPEALSAQVWAVPALVSVYGPDWLAAWPLAFQPQQATLLSVLTPQKL